VSVGHIPLLITSQFGIVMVECDKKACVHLYNPTRLQGIGQARDMARSLVEKQARKKQKER